ncbi:MAG: ComEC/Rec2 family competence protein [Opitutaceae bacterium]
MSLVLSTDPPVSPEPPARSLGHRAPLLHLALPHFAGLAAGHAAGSIPAGPLLAAALVLGAAALGLAARPAPWALLLHLALGAAGAASHALHRDWLGDWDHLPPREAELELRIDRLYSSPGERRATGLGRITRAPPHLADLSGRRVSFALTVPPGTDPPLRGTEVAARAILTALPRAPPPGGFDAYLTAIGVQFRLQRGTITAETRPAGAYARFCAAAADRFRRILDLGLAERRPELAALLRGMMLGDTKELAADQRDRFQRSGTMHLFAISGLNIGVIAVALRSLLSLARVPPWPALVLGSATLWLFVDITGASPSAVRAWAMATFLQAAQVGRQPGNLVAALAASALGVLVLEPLDAFSTSFLLSYAIVLALLVLGLPLGDCWQQRCRLWPLRPEAERRPWHRAAEAGLRGLAVAGAVGLATTLVSLITGVHFFGLLTPGSFGTNLLLLPAATLVTLAGFTALLAGLVGAEFAAVIGNHAAALVLAGIDAVITATVDLPGFCFPARCTAPWVGPAALTLLLATLLAGYALGWRRRFGGWWPPFGIVALFLVLGVEAEAAGTAMRVEVPPAVHRFHGMKSAYELAMERLAKHEPAPGRALTPEQKSRLADIDRVYQGRWAEREIFLRQQLDAALADSNFEETRKIQEQLANEKARLEEDRESEKNKVRREAEES